MEAAPAATAIRLPLRSLSVFQPLSAGTISPLSPACTSPMIDVTGMLLATAAAMLLSWPKPISSWLAATCWTVVVEPLPSSTSTSTRGREGAILFGEQQA